MLDDHYKKSGTQKCHILQSYSLLAMSQYTWYHINDYLSKVRKKPFKKYLLYIYIGLQKWDRHYLKSFNSFFINATWEISWYIACIIPECKCWLLSAWKTDIHSFMFYRFSEQIVLYMAGSHIYSYESHSNFRGVCVCLKKINFWTWDKGIKNFLPV